jgi:3-isopropylmalate dehydrogenase
MMLRYSFDLAAEAAAVENAVKEVLASGYRTPDIFTSGNKLTGTSGIGDLIAARIRKQV